MSLSPISTTAFYYLNYTNIHKIWPWIKQKFLKCIYLQNMLVLVAFNFSQLAPIYSLYYRTATIIFAWCARLLYSLDLGKSVFWVPIERIG